MIRTLLIPLLLLSSAPAFSLPELPAPSTNLDDDPLFDTNNLLKNQSGVREHLKKYYNAESIIFTTQDNFDIHGIWVPRTNATHTTIVSGGFFPNNKEGMSTLVKLLPDESNILFFDARRQGENNALLSFVAKLRRYGKHHYKDVIGAMDYAHKKDDTKPLVTLGLCAGGFHTLRALCELKKKNELEKYNVKGIILDSAFTSSMQVVPAGYYHFKHVLLAQFLRTWIFCNDRTAAVSDRLLHKIIWNSIGYPLTSLAIGLVKGGIQEHDHVSRVDDKIQILKDTPILYLHEEKDQYAPLANIQALKENHNNGQDELVIFQGSRHANNLLIKKHEYRNAVRNFAGKILPNNQTTTA